MSSSHAPEQEDSAHASLHAGVDDDNDDDEKQKQTRQHKPAATLSPAIPREEGLQGWLCAAGGFLTVCASFGFLNAIGVFQIYYEETYLRAYSSSEISWIFSFQLMMMWAPGPLVGRLVDTYGPLVVLIPSSILCVFSLCMTSLATEYYQIFLAQGVGFGIGAGGVFTSSFISVGQWFVQRRGLGVGIASAGSSVGGVFFPLFLYKLIEEVGFPGAIRYTALLDGILLAAGCLLIRGRLPRKSWDWKAKWFEPSLLLDPQFALFTWGSFLVMWGLWVPFDFISSYAVSQGVSEELSIALISMINATSIVSRLLPAYIADRVGHFNVISVSNFSIGITILCLWLPFDFHPSIAGTIVFALMYGLVSGTFVTLLMPCVAKLGSIETMGMRFGTFQLVIAVACLTGLPISGAILADQGGNTYWGTQTFALTSALVGAMLAAGSTLMIRKKRGTWKV